MECQDAESEKELQKSKKMVGFSNAGRGDYWRT